MFNALDEVDLTLAWQKAGVGPPVSFFDRIRVIRRDVAIQAAAKRTASNGEGDYKSELVGLSTRLPTTPAKGVRQNPQLINAEMMGDGSRPFRFSLFTTLFLFKSWTNVFSEREKTTGHGNGVTSLYQREQD